MSDAIIVALISGAGTLIGSIAGIMAANKLTNYRISQLENKVDKHNNVIVRMFEAEKRLDLHEEKIKVANNRIDDLEEKG